MFVEISLQFNRYLPNSGCMVFVVDVFQHVKWICSYGIMLAPSWTNACMVDASGFSSFISLRIQKIKEHILECWQIWSKWAAMGGSSCRESQATGSPLDGPITGHCWSSTRPLWFTNSSVEHTILFSYLTLCFQSVVRLSKFLVCFQQPFVWCQSFKQVANANI